MRYGLIFAGQGLQHGGTLAWLDAEPGGDRLLRRHFGADWRARMADGAWSHANPVAQPLLTGLALGAWQRIAPGLPPPAAIAGYSVGELASFCAAGVFDADRAMELAQQRAAAMDAAARHIQAGLLGIAGLPTDAVAAVGSRFGLELAVRLGTDTAVLGGTHAALEQAGQETHAAGARVTPLQVTVPSHTRWMRPAAEAFAHALAHTPLHRPRTVLLSNYTGDRIADAEQARVVLTCQIDHVVHWDRCMAAMAERGVRCVLEVGAGNALTRLWSARFGDIPARAADDFRSAGAARAWIERHGAD